MCSKCAQNACELACVNFRVSKCVCPLFQNACVRLHKNSFASSSASVINPQKGVFSTYLKMALTSMLSATKVGVIRISSRFAVLFCFVLSSRKEREGGRILRREK